MTKTYFTYDRLNGSLLMESDENGNTIATYSNDLDGTPLSQRRNGVNSTYHYDGMDNVVAVTDDNGDVTDTYEYSAFGEVIAKTGNTVNPFGFKGALGYYASPGSDDLYVRERTYQPKIGRWLSMDPMQFVDGANLYLSKDPLGLGNGANLNSPGGTDNVAFAQRGSGAGQVDGSCTQPENVAIQAGLARALRRLARHPGCFDRMRNASEECKSQLHDCITAALNRMTIKCAFIGQGKCHGGRPVPKGVTESLCAEHKSDAARGYWIWAMEKRHCSPCEHPSRVANNCELCGSIESGLVFGSLNPPQPITTWLCRSQRGRAIVQDVNALAELLVHEASHNCVGGHDTTNIQVPGGKQDECERPDSQTIENAFSMCRL